MALRKRLPATVRHRYNPQRALSPSIEDRFIPRWRSTRERLFVVGLKGGELPLWSPRALVAIGFLMLLLISLQGWGIAGIIASTGQERSELLQELKRLHNLGLSGGFLAISFGLALLVLPVQERHSKTICRLLVPSLLVAPAAFCDRTLAVLVGSIPSALQVCFYSLQAVSALGITVSLALIVILLCHRSSSQVEERASAFRDKSHYP